VEKKKLPFSKAPEDDRNLADIHLGLYDDVIVFDHVEKVILVIIDFDASGCVSFGKYHFDFCSNHSLKFLLVPFVVLILYFDKIICLDVHVSWKCYGHDHSF
jgi:hypothetical protein